MDVCFCGKERVGERLKKYGGVKNDLLLFGFGGLGEICYERELNGATRQFEEAALLSKKSGAILISGCLSNTRGHKRKSALVAENGRLLGISDCVHTTSREISCGALLRVYETGRGRMGVLVAEDIAYLESAQALAACGSDFLVCILAEMRDVMPLVLARAYAYALGVPVFLCSDDYGAAVSERGEVCVAAAEFPFSYAFAAQTEYRLVQTRRRGFGIT